MRKAPILAGAAVLGAYLLGSERDVLSSRFRELASPHRTPSVYVELVSQNSRTSRETRYIDSASNKASGKFSTHTDPKKGYAELSKRNPYTDDRDFFRKPEEPFLFRYRRGLGNIEKHWRGETCELEDSDNQFDSVEFIGEESRECAIDDMDPTIKKSVRFEGFRYVLKAEPVINEIRGIVRDPRDELKPSVLKTLGKVPELVIFLWLPFMDGVDRDALRSIMSTTSDTGILDKYVTNNRREIVALSDSARSP